MRARLSFSLGLFYFVMSDDDYDYFVILLHPILLSWNLPGQRDICFSGKRVAAGAIP